MLPEIMEIIQRSLDTIEGALRTEISVQELADEAGFSLYHFYHVFEAVTGMSVGRYVTRRRLLHAVWDMSRGKEAIAAALEYGFDTHAGFYKAFRREFGCAPTRYLRTHRAACPARVSLKEERKMIDRKMITRALKAWGIAQETVSPVYYANTGRCSENVFAVGQDAFIRVSARPGELQRQARLHRALEKQGLSAPVVPTLAGEDVLHEAEFDCMLLERTHGQPVNALSLLTHPETARALGEGLARLHAALRDCDPLLCKAEDYAVTLRAWAAPVVREALEDTAWLEEYLARVEATFPALPAQIIHRDPNPDNVLMDGGRVTGFLDFELTRVMSRIFDLCYAATGLLSVAFADGDETLRMRFFDAARAIWQGYDSVSPLTAAEKAALPDMVLAIELTCVAAFAGSERLKHVYEANRGMLAFIRAHIGLLAW